MTRVTVVIDVDKELSDETRSTGLNEDGSAEIAGAMLSVGSVVSITKTTPAGRPEWSDVQMDELIDRAQTRLIASRLGKSWVRETDADLLVIRDLLDALAAARTSPAELPANIPAPPAGPRVRDVHGMTWIAEDETRTRWTRDGGTTWLEQEQLVLYYGPVHPDPEGPISETATSSVICPECVQGKHSNCDGTALNPDSDEIVSCECEVPR